MTYYILNENKKVKATEDLMAWGKMFDSDERIVAKTEIGDAKVSTVFLGLSHRWSGEPGLWFETMIFGGEHDQYQERYDTWEEAEKGHEKAVQMVKSKSHD